MLVTQTPSVCVFSPSKWAKSVQVIPSRELTYPPKNGILSRWFSNLPFGGICIHSLEGRCFFISAWSHSASPWSWVFLSFSSRTPLIKRWIGSTQYLGVWLMIGKGGRGKQRATYIYVYIIYIYKIYIYIKRNISFRGGDEMDFYRAFFGYVGSIEVRACLPNCSTHCQQIHAVHSMSWCHWWQAHRRTDSRPWSYGRSHWTRWEPGDDGMRIIYLPPPES